MLIRVCDVESTGIDDPCEMVEIGWTDLRLFPDGWQIESGPRSTLVNPGLPISFPAMAVHHITDAECRIAGADPDDIRAEIVKGVDVLCAHNAAFDGRFIRGHNLPWICTFKAARTIWPDLQSHGNGSIRYERGLCLGDDRAYPPHRAGPDTWVTAHILLDLLNERSVEDLLDISSKPVLLRKCPLNAHYGKPWAEVPWSYLDWIVNKSTMPGDPTKEDIVHTARVELERRAAAPKDAPAQDPDAWRNQAGSFR